MAGEDEVAVHDVVASVIEQLVHGSERRPGVAQEESLGAGNVNLEQFDTLSL